MHAAGTVRFAKIPNSANAGVLVDGLCQRRTHQRQDSDRRRVHERATVSDAISEGDKTSSKRDSRAAHGEARTDRCPAKNSFFRVVELEPVSEYAAERCPRANLQRRGTISTGRMTQMPGIKFGSSMNAISSRRSRRGDTEDVETEATYLVDRGCSRNRDAIGSGLNCGAAMWCRWSVSR